MGKPIAAPRSQGFHDRRQSSRDIQIDPVSAIGRPWSIECRETMCSVSPIANRPTASVVTSIPSRSCGTSKVSRACPVSMSIPISPSQSPIARLVRPRRTELPNVAETVTKAISISAK